MLMQVPGTQSTSVFVTCVSELFGVWHIVVCTVCRQKSYLSHSLHVPLTLLSGFLAVQLTFVCTVCRRVPCRWRQCLGCVPSSWVVVHCAKGSLQG